VIDRVFDFFNLAPIVPDNADFNEDGTANAADYVVWRKFNGTSVPAGAPGDANNSGQINDADYAIWIQQFGSPPPAGGSKAETEFTSGTSDAAAGYSIRSIDASAKKISVSRRFSGLYPYREMAIGTRVHWADVLARFGQQPSERPLESDVASVDDFEASRSELPFDFAFDSENVTHSLADQIVADFRGI
jgi:hypothetical protein